MTMAVITRYTSLKESFPRPNQQAFYSKHCLIKCNMTLTRFLGQTLLSSFKQAVPHIDSQL